MRAHFELATSNYWKYYWMFLHPTIGCTSNRLNISNRWIMALTAFVRILLDNNKKIWLQKISDLTFPNLTWPVITWLVLSQLQLTCPDLISLDSNWIDLSWPDLTSPDTTVPTWLDLSQLALSPFLTWPVVTWPVLTWPVDTLQRATGHLPRAA